MNKVSGASRTTGDNSLNLTNEEGIDWMNREEKGILEWAVSNYDLFEKLVFTDINQSCESYYEKYETGNCFEEMTYNDCNQIRKKLEQMLQDVPMQDREKLVKTVVVAAMKGKRRIIDNRQEETTKIEGLPDYRYEF